MLGPYLIIGPIASTPLIRLELVMFTAGVTRLPSYEQKLNALRKRATGDG